MAGPSPRSPFTSLPESLSCQLRNRACLSCVARAKRSHHGNSLADGDLRCHGNVYKIKKYFGGLVAAEKKGGGDCS